jgi:hypothetical protein
MSSVVTQQKYLESVRRVLLVRPECPVIEAAHPIAAG